MPALRVQIAQVLDFLCLPLSLSGGKNACTALERGVGVAVLAVLLGGGGFWLVKETLAYCVTLDEVDWADSGESEEEGSEEEESEEEEDEEEEDEEEEDERVIEL